MKLLFYALFSESKSRDIIMKGPFIHRKPIETVLDENERYAFTDEDIKKECQYLSIKYSSEVPIFKIMDFNGKCTMIIVQSHYKQASTFFEQKHENMRYSYGICTK